MKKKFLSGFLALAMALAVFVPVMAEGSPTRPEQATVEEQSVGDITITSDSTKDDGTKPVITFKQSSMTNEKAESVAKSAVSSDYKYVTVFELDANALAKAAISKTPISVTVTVDGAKAGEKYLALHLNDNGEVIESLNCTVSKDGAVTINGIRSCSPFVLVKETTGSSDDSGSTGGSTKHEPTCEEALGKEWTWSVAKNTCVYRVTNTATK